MVLLFSKVSNNVVIKLAIFFKDQYLITKKKTYVSLYKLLCSKNKEKVIYTRTRGSDC